MSAFTPETLSGAALADANRHLATLDATRRVEWALRHIAGNHALSTSFGVQSAVSLHLITRIRPDIPVILIDTGYLFPETYRYADRLTELLDLNLKVYQPELGSAWMEARLGKLWENGSEASSATTSCTRSGRCGARWTNWASAAGTRGSGANKRPRASTSISSK